MTTYGFSSEDDFRRMRDIVRRVESERRGQPPSRARWQGGAADGPTWGKATSTSAAYSVITVNIKTGLPRDGTDASETIKCVTIHPTVDGVPGFIVPAPSLFTTDGDDDVTFSFQPFVTTYKAIAAADWSPDSAFNVTVPTGPIDTEKTVSALAPDISGTGMNGVKGLIVPLWGSTPFWAFIPRGCVGSA